MILSQPLCDIIKFIRLPPTLFKGTLSFLNFFLSFLLLIHERLSAMTLKVEALKSLHSTLAHISKSLKPKQSATNPLNSPLFHVIHLQVQEEGQGS